MLQNQRTSLGSCGFHMFLDQFFQFFDIVFVFHFFNGNHIFVQIPIQMAVLIEYISDTTAHTCCKVLSCLTKNDHTATGHIFTSMFSHTLYNCVGSGVTDCKTFPCHTIDKYFTAGGSIQGYVTGDDILFCFVSSVLRREDNQFSTGKSFSIIIVGITAQAQCQSFRDKCPKALSAGTGTVDGNSVFRQSVFVLTGDLCTEDRTEGTVGVADFQIQRSFRSLLYGFLQFL